MQRSRKYVKVLGGGCDGVKEEVLIGANLQTFQRILQQHTTL